MEILQKTKVGDLDLPNRMVMAPLTRLRAEAGNQPGKLMSQYYCQRAGFGLIISEGVPVSPMGHGFPDTPGLHSDAQEAGWTQITKNVHQAGGRIFCQLWHVGRQSHPVLLPGAAKPVAPSAIAADGQVTTEAGNFPHPLPHALSTTEVEETVADFALAALRAKRAGFDGVEIHGAHGYLIDQFLRDGSNQREDRYGGSPKKRLRFLAEILDAVSTHWPTSKIGVRISPAIAFGAMHDSDPESTFSTVVAYLQTRSLAYLHITEPRKDGRAAVEASIDFGAAWARQHFKGSILSSGGHDECTAGTFLDKGLADLIGFGRLAIANPDLPQRFQQGAHLNLYDRSTFYGGGEEGYTDYPFLRLGSG